MNDHQPESGQTGHKSIRYEQFKQSRTVAEFFAVNEISNSITTWVFTLFEDNPTTG